MNKIAAITLVLALLASTPITLECLAATTENQATSPFQQGSPATPYTVVTGDTLWGISARFLRDPWLWPEVWHHNSHIANPHLIYPGDQVHLVVDGQGHPRFTIQRQGKGATRQRERLYPQVVIGPVQQNEEGLSSAQKEYLSLFLKRNSIFSADTLHGIGHIVAPVKEHLVLSQGDLVLLSVNDKVASGETLAIYRNGTPLVDQNTQQALGRIVEHVGMVRVERLTPQGPVARIVEIFNEILANDRVAWPITVNADFNIHFPSPETEIKGTVLYIQNNLAEAGAHQVVAVGLGRQNRLAQGAVMTVYRAGRTLPETAKKGEWDTATPGITMPDEKIGSAVVFFLGEKTAFALLMRTLEPVHQGDILANR